MEIVLKVYNEDISYIDDVDNLIFGFTCMNKEEYKTVIKLFAIIDKDNIIFELVNNSGYTCKAYYQKNKETSIDLMENGQQFFDIDIEKIYIGQEFVFKRGIELDDKEYDYVYGYLV